MNCKPGDLAIIVGLPKCMASANGRIVRIAMMPPFFEDGVPYWRLDDVVRILTSTAGKTAHGVFFAAGERAWFRQIPDHCLRPIRDPGDDAVDEMVLRVGKPEKVSA